MNLTAIRTLDEAVVRHYAESVFLAKQLEHGSTVLDVGSGAGFPGFPMAIVRPEWTVTLVESNQRKATFLREASRELPNVRLVAGRAEDLEGEWHWIVSRAVRPTDVVNVASRHGQGIALLISADDAARIPGPIRWREPIRLPWGERRVALLGDVPRGTVVEITVPRGT